MTSLASPVKSLDSVADLIDYLGGISPRRIRLDPPPGSATEADVLVALAAPRKRLCELVDGVLVEKAMGYRESLIASYLISLMQAFVRARNLGHVTAPDGTIRLWAGRVRMPDVAFYSWDRLPGRKLPSEPIPTLAPTLAIEVLSSTNTAQEMAQKRQDYFTAGVQQVWEIDPQTRILSRYTTVDEKTVFAVDEAVDGAPVLPGFTLQLRELFGELDRHG